MTSVPVDAICDAVSAPSDRLGPCLSRSLARHTVSIRAQGHAGPERSAKGADMSSKLKSRSIGLLPLLGLLVPLACQAGDERKQLAFDVVDRNAGQMTAISDSIFYFGELGMQEFESTKLLKGTLEAAGFRVELGGAGMPTNLWAEWGSGYPKVAVVTEVDALPGG